jgi:hypothetical protein
MMDIGGFGLIVVYIKPDYSPLGMLGKLFFRRQAPWVQRRNMIVVMWAIVVGFLCGGVMVALTLFQNASKN